MTPDDYKKQHGKKWASFASSPAGEGLLNLIESQHPTRSIPKGNDNLGLLTNGAVALLNKVAGYEELAEIIRNLKEPPTEPTTEPPDDFQSDEVTGKRIEK